MKFSTALLPLFCATLATSRSLRDSQQQSLNLNPSFPVPGNTELEFCADPSTYPGSVEFVNLDPYPPRAGEKLIIAAKGILERDIVEGAKLHLTVKLNKYLTLINKLYDVCENADKIDLECPIEAGPIEITREANLPAFIPPGTYTVEATVLDEDGTTMVCLDTAITFHIGH